MGWRFRRRVTVLPGVTVNVSDKSVGVTVGGQAGRVSASSSGRVTVGQSLPGTGLFRSEVVRSGRAKGAPGAPAGRRAGGCGRWLVYGLIGLAGLFGCGVLANVLAPGDVESPARVVPTWTSTPSATPAATMTPAPTATVAATMTPMPTVGERAAPVLVLPTATASGPVCDCSTDQYTCGSFENHAEAQACFEFCVESGAGDVHQLDGDGDGFVCED